MLAGLRQVHVPLWFTMNQPEQVLQASFGRSQTVVLCLMTV